MKKIIPPMISGAVTALCLIVFDKLGYANYVFFVIAIVIGVAVSLIIGYLTSNMRKHK